MNERRAGRGTDDRGRLRRLSRSSSNDLSEALSEEENDDGDFVETKQTSVNLPRRKARRILDDEDDDVEDMELDDFQRTGISRTTELVEPPIDTVAIDGQTVDRGAGNGSAREQGPSLDVTSLDPYVRRLLSVVNFLSSYRCAEPFFLPTNQIRGYSDVIQRPMDLSVVGDSVLNGLYGNTVSNADIYAFINDVRLVWSNSVSFNTLESKLGRDACFLSSVFDIEMGMVMECLDCTVTMPFSSGEHSIVAPKESRSTEHKSFSENSNTFHRLDGSADEIAAGVDALNLMADFYDRFSDSDQCLSAAYRISLENQDVQFEIKENLLDPIDSCMGTDGNVFDVIVEEVDRGNDLITWQASEELIDVDRSLQLLVGVAGAHIHLAEGDMTAKLQNWIDLYGREFPLSGDSPRTNSVSVSKDKEAGDINQNLYKSKFSAYEDFLIQKNSMPFFYMKIKKAILTSVIRNVICETSEPKITKRWSLHFQKGKLFNLRPDMALDFYPAVSRLIKLEKEAFMKMGAIETTGLRQSRETRRSVGMLVQPFQYLSKVFPQIGEDLFEFLYWRFSYM